MNAITYTVFCAYRRAGRARLHYDTVVALDAQQAADKVCADALNDVLVDDVIVLDADGTEHFVANLPF